MRDRVVMLSDLGRRGSWLPDDFIYQTGDRVHIAGEKVVVVDQDGDTVRVSTVEVVPGSSTEFSCGPVRPVSVYDIGLRKNQWRK